MRRLLSCLTIILLATAGCQTVDSVRGEAADLLLPPEQEAELGAQLRDEILKELKPTGDARVQRYVESVGRGLAKQMEFPEPIAPRFTVLQGDDINAFAIPGGDVFVFEGLIRATGTEAELAGVLAHELGHVKERHVAEALVTQLGLDAVLSMVLGRNPSLVGQIAGTVAANGYLLRHSRRAETEADRVGMATMIASPYNPAGMIRFFDVLAEQQGRAPSRVEVFLSSHPPPANRAEALRAQLQEAGNPGGVENREQLVQIQQRLPRRAAEVPGDRGEG